MLAIPEFWASQNPRFSYQNEQPLDSLEVHAWPQMSRLCILWGQRRRRRYPTLKGF